MAGRSRRTSGCTGAGADMCASFNHRRRAGPENRGVRTRLTTCRSGRRERNSRGPSATKDGRDEQGLCSREGTSGGHLLLPIV